MFRSLSWKITLAFMLGAFTTAVLFGLFIRITSVDRLTQLVIDQQRSSLEQTLSEYYAVNGSWNGVDQNWRQIATRNFPLQPGNQASAPVNNNQPPPDHGPRNFLGLADSQGKVVVPVDPNYPVGSKMSVVALKGGSPVEVNGKQVGTILIARQPPGLSSPETQFLAHTTQALLYAIPGVLLISLILGFVLARTITGPLKALTNAAQSITRGQLEQQVTVRSNDEVGQLAIAFNRMSQEVARVNQLRRQMTADIAHDLRTPLTTISGYIESMQDGVLEPTPERLALIYSEIERLQNLVGDLRTLSLADAGELALNPQNLSAQHLLERSAALFQHQAEQQGVSISVNAPEELPGIQVDEARMIRVLGNLITNALRYTPGGGKITLSAQRTTDQLEICVQDTGAGISTEELPFIFDRFHRADKSRHTENGESGLGLAIVKALVDSHGGSIWAESTPGLGTTMHLLFPLSLEKN